MKHGDDKGNPLRKNGCTGSAFSVHTKGTHQKKIQNNIDYCCNRHKIKRAFGISQPLQDGADCVIAKYKYGSITDDFHISAGILHGRRRYMQHPKKRPVGGQTGCGDKDCGNESGCE